QTIRVPPIPTLVEVFKAFGANPVPMIWGEVYLAVKQGTVDGLELPVTTAVSDKFHEITKYYSRTLHSYPAAVWVMAKPKYDEVARLCFVWTVFLGAAVAVRRGTHFRLHLLIDRVGARPRRAVDVLVTLIVMAFGGVLVTGGLAIAPIARRQVTDALEISML